MHRSPHLFAFVTNTVLAACSRYSLYPPQFSFAMASGDRDALVALFWMTGGASWNKNDNWDTDAELATWHGVEVNDQGRVEKLSLASNNLRGKCTRGGELLLSDLLDRPKLFVDRRSPLDKI